ncbi:hypothetical protein [Paenibacillus sp. A3M_27_13]|uniref:hypothetical protein n=1 Tax=Paenibacillus sp. A3M_27_13 TaxID=2962029 RepID=UPI0020B80173|nr:hypothetical protein [Paenibacillus sp. A3M_27_13]MCP3746593.1 hypothetical protein [Paenibacillus sp. A3M_27_13]
MLPDIERNRRMPTMKELEGRRIEDIKAGLLALEKDNYILWENKSDTWHIVIIEGWDRDQKIVTPPGSANRYYTEY